MKDLLLELQMLIHKATSDYQNRTWLRYDMYCTQLNKLILSAKSFLKDIPIALIDTTAHKSNFNKQGALEAYDMLAERVKLKEVIDRANSLLETLMISLVPATIPNTATNTTPVCNALSDVELVCNNFCSVVRELRRRSDSGKLLDIETTGDVLYLFKSLLRLYFDSISEDTRTSACSDTSLALLFRPEKIVLLVKKTYRRLTDQEIINDFTEVLAHYAKTTDYTSLFYFIYDPNLRISQPTYLESELIKLNTTPLAVKIFIRPLS